MIDRGGPTSGMEGRRREERGKRDRGRERGVLLQGWRDEWREERGKRDRGRERGVLLQGWRDEGREERGKRDRGRERGVSGMEGRMGKNEESVTEGGREGYYFRHGGTKEGRTRKT